MVPKHRTFSRAELAFFAVPRKWVPAIVARFGDDSDVRDAIIQVDEDGGLSFLRWRAGPQTWELSEKGRRWVGNRMIGKAMRQYPDTRVSEAEKVADSLLPEMSPIGDARPSSFLCPACGTKSLGSDKCMACEPPAEGTT